MESVAATLSGTVLTAPCCSAFPSAPLMEAARTAPATAILAGRALCAASKPASPTVSTENASRESAYVPQASKATVVNLESVLECRNAGCWAEGAVTSRLGSACVGQDGEERTACLLCSHAPTSASTGSATTELVLARQDTLVLTAVSLTNARTSALVDLLGMSLAPLLFEHARI